MLCPTSNRRFVPTPDLGQLPKETTLPSTSDPICNSSYALVIRVV